MARLKKSKNPGEQDELSKGLLPNEQISFSIPIGRNVVSDEELNSRYAKGDIRIVTESARYSLAGILSMLQERVIVDDESGGEKELRYKLDPEYQRRHRWSVERKSRLIESFLMNVPVPPVFLYERDLARFEVMDGRQRLTALSEFYADKFALTGLQYWADLDGRTYSQLPTKVRDGIDRRYISSIILLKETAATEEQAALLKKIVFERLNSGGVRLSSQETRNAVYNGRLNQLCLHLSENEKFRKMWGIRVDEADDSDADSDSSDGSDESTKAGARMFERMEDVELVLRFFAYRQINSFKMGLNKISEFLDIFLMKGNQFPVETIGAYRNLFESTIEFLWDALDTSAFCVINDTKTSRPTKIAYDPIMYAANTPEVLAARERLIQHKEILRDELLAMYKQDKAEGCVFSGRRTNYADAQERNRLTLMAFSAAIAKIQ